MTGQDREGPLVTGQNGEGRSVTGQNQEGPTSRGINQAGLSIKGKTREGQLVRGQNREGRPARGQNREGWPGLTSDHVAFVKSPFDLLLWARELGEVSLHYPWLCHCVNSAKVDEELDLGESTLQ